MNEVAKSSGLSERSLNRVFLRELSIAPKEALIRLRLVEARRLIRDNELSVTEAAFEAEYHSLSKFIQAYRSTFGELPSETK